MPEKGSRTIEYVIGALVVVLLVLVVFLALNYRELRRSAVIGAHQSFLSALLTHRHHGPATVADLAAIQPWMTFDYLNKFFALPPQYLQTQLSIADPAYPRLTIGGYVKYAHLDLATFLRQLDAALRAQLMNATTTSASATAAPQGYL